MRAQKGRHITRSDSPVCRSMGVVSAFGVLLALITTHISASECSSAGLVLCGVSGVLLGVSRVLFGVSGV